MHEQMEFVRGVWHVRDLTNTAQTVSTSKNLRIKGFRLNPGAADETVIFRRPGAGAEYFREPIPSGASPREIEVPWCAVDGLEVITTTAAGDVWVTIFYYTD